MLETRLLNVQAHTRAWIARILSAQPLLVFLLVSFLIFSNYYCRPYMKYEFLMLANLTESEELPSPTVTVDNTVDESDEDTQQESK